MQILCNRCIRGVESRGERLFTGEMIDNVRESCFWCEATDTDLFKVVFNPVTYDYDVGEGVNRSRKRK
jgi:hypothetical protein